MILYGREKAPPNLEKSDESRVSPPIGHTGLYHIGQSYSELY